jgi:hypothetical protein
MEPATAGAEILTEAYNLITGDRQNDYDHPLEDYSRTVGIFREMTGISLSVEEGILFMICVKFSRFANELQSGLNVPDNLRDAAGYIGCLKMAMEKQRQEESEFDQLLDQLHKHYKTGDSTWG